MSNTESYIILNENREIVNRLVGRPYSGLFVLETSDLKQARNGDTIQGDITVVENNPNLQTILNPELVEKPKTPAELKRELTHERYRTEKKIEELNFQLMFCQSRYQMAVNMGDIDKKDKELAKYKVLEAEQEALETKVAELIANGAEKWNG